MTNLKCKYYDNGLTVEMTVEVTKKVSHLHSNRFIICKELNPRMERPGGPRVSRAQAPPLHACQNRPRPREEGEATGHKKRTPGGSASTATGTRQDRGELRRQASGRGEEKDQDRKTRKETK